MSTHAGPNIIEDGLVLFLDPSNEKSYSGSGTSWSNLVSNQLSGTLSNTVTFDEESKGCFSFNGTNEFFNMTSNVESVALKTNYSCSIWIKLNSSTSGIDKRFFWHGNYGVLVYKTATNGIILYIRTVSGTVQQSFIPNPSILFDKWINICGTYDGETMSLYINGYLVGSRPQSGGIINDNPQMFFLGGTSTSFFTECKISSVSVYFSALSAAQVNNNFNALRSRYGL
jgi:hypothetical protein